MTPFDKPKSLLDRLIFPSLRQAYRLGLKHGWDEGHEAGRKWFGNDPGLTDEQLPRNPHG